MNNNETLFRQFHQLMNLMMRRRMHMRADRPHDMDLGRGQGHLLHILREHDGMSQKELCELLHIRPASLGELVDKLEQRGFVQRKENENDKRTTNVFLTDQGREFIEKLTAGRAEHMGSLFGGLCEEEQQQLSALLEKLIGSLQQDPGDWAGRGFGPMGFGHGRHPHGHHGFSGHDGAWQSEAREQNEATGEATCGRMDCRKYEYCDHTKCPPLGNAEDRNRAEGGFHVPFWGVRPGHGRDRREDEREFRNSHPQHHSDNILDELFWDAEF